jgi:hypothetical protein
LNGELLFAARKSAGPNDFPEFSTITVSDSGFLASSYNKTYKNNKLTKHL